MAWAIFVLFILVPRSIILCNAETYYANIAKPNHQAQRVIPHQSKQSSSFVDEAVGLICQLRNHAGYYPIKNSHGAKGRLEDPLILWLSGRHGCSNKIALFYENGRFQINNDPTLRTNEFGWDKVLYVDQPTGTGFSYTADDRDMCHNKAGVSGDLYDFLQDFVMGDGLTNSEYQVSSQLNFA